MEAIGTCVRGHYTLQGGEESHIHFLRLNTVNLLKWRTFSKLNLYPPQGCAIMANMSSYRRYDYRAYLTQGQRLRGFRHRCN